MFRRIINKPIFTRNIKNLSTSTTKYCSNCKYYNAENKGCKKFIMSTDIIDMTYEKTIKVRNDENVCGKDAKEYFSLLNDQYLNLAVGSGFMLTSLGVHEYLSDHFIGSVSLVLIAWYTLNMSKDVYKIIKIKHFN